jgi:hypothetical protein
LPWTFCNLAFPILLTLHVSYSTFAIRLLSTINDWYQHGKCYIYCTADQRDLNK